MWYLLRLAFVKRVIPHKAANFLADLSFIALCHQGDILDNSAISILKADTDTVAIRFLFCGQQSEAEINYNFFFLHKLTSKSIPDLFAAILKAFGIIAVFRRKISKSLATAGNK